MLVIKGWSKPKSCGRCPFNNSSCYCSITKSQIDRDYEYRLVLEDCPISETNSVR